VAKRAIKVKGSKKVRDELRQLTARYPRALAAALYEEAAIIFAMSQRRSPVDTGRHRSTGTLPPPEFMGGNIIQEIGYGTEYSFAIHENKRNVTFHGEGEQQDHYLSGPFEERTPGMFDRLARRTRINAESGKGLTALPELKGPQDIGPSRWADPEFRRKQRKQRSTKKTTTRKRRAGTSSGKRRGR
jgi:hypothetical protein